MWAALPLLAQVAAPSLNPDISAVFHVVGGYREDAPVAAGHEDPAGTGVHNQEIELALQSNVDPYLRAELYLALAGDGPIEIEEGFFQTLALPAGLQLKGGVFRSAFGRENGQHLEQLDFVDRALIGPALLGDHGLRAPGVQVALLAPTPFYLELSGEALATAGGEGHEHAEEMDHAGEPAARFAPSFGGGDPEDLSYVATLETFADFGTAGLRPGLSWATGLGEHGRTHVAGADLTFRYRPASRAAGWFELLLQGEYLVRRRGGGAPRETGGYAQVVARLARRWHAGVRGEALADLEVVKVAPVLTVSPSEFSRVRLQYSLERPAPAVYTHAAFVQVEFSIGPHGAHPY